GFSSQIPSSLRKLSIMSAQVRERNTCLSTLMTRPGEDASLETRPTPPVLAFSLRPATVRAGRCKRSRPALFARALFHSLKRESMVKWLKVALHKKPCMKTPVVRDSGRDASGMTYFAQQGGIASGSSLGQPEGLRDSSRWSID